MKSNIRRIALFLLTLAIAVVAAFMPVQVEAASKPYMKTVNVKWDLKKDKTITYKSKYAGLGMMKQKVKITGYKIKNAKKKGYKELTFTVNYLRRLNLSKRQVHKCAKSQKYQSIVINQEPDGGLYFVTAVDYGTGKCLDVHNDKGVTVKKGVICHKAGKIYRDRDGCSVYISTKVTRKMKVTYPKKYKGLCIGVGGSRSIEQTPDDTAFLFGNVAFGKTSYYGKKDKSVAHFMRVTK